MDKGSSVVWLRRQREKQDGNMCAGRQVFLTKNFTPSNITMVLGDGRDATGATKDSIFGSRKRVGRAKEQLQVQPRRQRR